MLKATANGVPAMNNMVQPPVLFQVTLNTEEIDTAMFGKVTVRELPSRRIAQLYADHDPQTRGESFGNALLCECVTGENGERFTVELLESLPNRALPDMRRMIQASVRLNGMNSEEVGKE